jgi:hypothetical protein
MVVTRVTREKRRAIGGMKRRTAAWILWPIVTLQVVLLSSGALLKGLARSDSSSLTFGFALDTVGIAITLLAFPAVGALIFWRRPEHPIGWLFLDQRFESAPRPFPFGVDTRNTADESSHRRCIDCN